MNVLDRVVRGFLDKLRPNEPTIREKLDFGFRFHKQSVELIEIRPRWNGKPGKTEHAFAKATFVRSPGAWKVYWMRGNLKWHPYEPATAPSLEAFLDLVHADKQHCFFG
ncbi:MAG: DUF3024 domain-containing protein [Elusimicrobiota bacterium]